MTYRELSVCGLHKHTLDVRMAFKASAASVKLKLSLKMCANNTN